MVKAAERYYSTSYFLETNYKAMKKAFEYASAKGRPVYFNLGAKKWINNFSEELLSILPYVEGIIGNAEEVIELNKIITGELSTIENAIKKICSLKTSSRKHRRFMVVTNSCDPTILGNWDGMKTNLESLITPRISNELIKNTNGAGDTLAGGFLGGQIIGLSLMNSIKLGQKMAFHYIQQTDGSYPKNLI